MILPRSLGLALVLLSSLPASAQNVLPQTAPAAPVASATPASVADAELKVVRGGITPRVVCAAEPRFSYALYLPEGYAPGRSWPVLFVFDPRGRGKLGAELFQEAAAAHGFVIASSNDTRSDDPTAPNNEAVMAMWADAHSRLGLDPKRHYAAGFSGGARLAVRVGIVLKGGLAGVIGVGGGLPAEADPRQPLPFAFYGAVGDQDFNYTELWQLDERLSASRTAHRIASFSGSHEWLPKALALEALDWLALRAMAEDRRPLDQAILDRYRKTIANRAGALEAAGRVGEALRLWQGLADDLAGFGGSSAAVQQADRLGSAARRDLERVRKQTARDREWIEAVHHALRGLRESPLPPVERLLKDFGHEALKADLASSDAVVKLSGERRLSALQVQVGYYAPSALKSQGLFSNAARSYEIATALDPESPWPHLGRAQVWALAGEKGRALDALRAAASHGLRQPRGGQSLSDEADFASLKGDPAFEEIVKGLPPPEERP